MHRSTALAIVITAFGSGCRTPAELEAPAEPPTVIAPERDGEPVSDVELSRNSGAALIRLADRITAIELRHGDETILRFDDEVRDELVESLTSTEVTQSLSATSPPWPNYWVILHVEGRAAPFVASIMAGGELRLNASDPYSLTIADEDGAPDFDNISDVGFSERMVDAVTEQIGSPQGKEYSRP